MSEAQMETTSNAEQGAVSPGGFATGPKSASGRIQVAKKDYDVETASFNVVFADGSKREVNLSDLPQEIQVTLALHGLAQKLGDSYASVKGNVGDAIKKFDAVLAQLTSGEWAAKREGEGSSKVTELAEAIARIKNVSVEIANAAVAKATDDQVKGWKANSTVKAVIAQIRAEKAQKRLEKEKEAGEIEIELPTGA